MAEDTGMKKAAIAELARRELAKRESKSQNVEAEGKPSAIDTAKDILTTGAYRTIEQPNNFRNITGGFGQTFFEEVKRAALAKAGLPTYSEGGGFAGTGISIENTPGEILAQATDPINLLGAKILAGGKLTKPASGNIQEMIKQSANEYRQSAAVIKQEQKAALSKAGSEYALAKTALKSEIDKIDTNVIPTAADKATLRAREVWFDIAKDVSRRYGADWRKAVENQKIDTQQLHDSLRRVVEKAGLFDKPEASWSKSEEQVFNLYQKIGKQVPATAETTEVVMTPQGPQRATIPTGSDTVNLGKFDRELQSIFRSKAGKKYSSGEHVLTLVREEITNTIGDASKAVSAVRKKYAPELQMKNESYNIFQPFNRSGTFDTTRGINFFSKYANGQANPDEIRLINALKSKAGQGFLDDLNSAAQNKVDFMIRRQNLANKQPAVAGEIIDKHTKKLGKNIAEHEVHQELLKGMMENVLSEEAKKSFGQKLIKYGAIGAAGAAGAGSVAAVGMEAAKIFSD
jgi:hypothetical protein